MRKWTQDRNNRSNKTPCFLNASTGFSFQLLVQGWVLMTLFDKWKTYSLVVFNIYPHNRLVLSWNNSVSTSFSYVLIHIPCWSRPSIREVRVLKLSNFSTTKALENQHYTHTHTNESATGMCQKLIKSDIMNW